MKTVFSHSQSINIPTCPKNTKELYTGFSFLGMNGNGRGQVNDLASPGSCLPTFNPIPFIFCEKEEQCFYATRNDRSYWLSGSNFMDMGMNINVSNVKSYISRCAVCEAPKKVN